MDELDFTDDDSAQVDYSNYDYSAYGLQDLGGGLWYDANDGTVFDASTGEWTTGDNSNSAAADDGGSTPANDPNYDYSQQGYQDLGDGYWYDPSDGGVLDTSTGQWGYGWFGDETAPADTTGYTDNADGGYTDPFGNTFFADGSIQFPDGTKWDPTDGQYDFAGGGSLKENGDFVDQTGVTWENLAWAGAPNIWQNTQTGDTWNGTTGDVVESTNVNATWQDLSAKAPSYTTSKPGASSGGGGGPSAGGGTSGGGTAAKPLDLSDINKLLSTLAQAQTAYNTAKNGGTTNAAQLAALQRQATAAAQNLQAAKSGQASSSIFGNLFKDKTTILIAAGIGALFLVTAFSNRGPQYVMVPANNNVRPT